MMDKFRVVISKPASTPPNPASTNVAETINNAAAIALWYQTYTGVNVTIETVILAQMFENQRMQQVK